jgi:hypothetical protein
MVLGPLFIILSRSPQKSGTACLGEYELELVDLASVRQGNEE